MKTSRILMCVFLVVIFTIINWAAFAFVLWEINPANWKEGQDICACAYLS